ncbi:MAG: CIA30 family protein [Gammaproteobacteria bacterium]|nr:CIA30 family protein [Gammaproteobacteria bacterium]
MTLQRRRLLALAGLAPFMNWSNIMAAEHSESRDGQPARRVLSDFTGDEPYVIENAGWRGFSDRVMGGVSDAQLELSNVGGKACARLTGTVTRESNGGFIQMAMYFGQREAELDASGYQGLELLVYGNNEDYNVHVRTADCGWYDDSYRHTFFAPAEWQRVQIPWSEFEANRVKEPLDTSRLTRIAILGWMREFQADISLAEIALYA